MVSRASTVNLSNMPAISEEVIEPNANISEDIRAFVAGSEEKWKVTKFESTPPMSTYIVAVANGEFEFLETSVKMPLSGKTIPLRIYGMAHYIGSAKFTELTATISHCGCHSPGSIRLGCQSCCSSPLRNRLQCRISSAQARYTRGA